VLSAAETKVKVRFEKEEKERISSTCYKAEDIWLFS